MTVMTSNFGDHEIMGPDSIPDLRMPGGKMDDITVVACVVTS